MAPQRQDSRKDRTAVSSSSGDPNHHLDTPASTTVVAADSLASRSARDSVRLFQAALAAEALESAELLVSELASNVVRHTTSAQMVVAITVAGGVLRVEVEDGDSARYPYVAPFRPTEPGGMGMRLVDQMASAWGTHQTQDGKCVWFELPSGV